jgi:ribonuclease D
MTNYLHMGDLPADVVFHGSVAIDTETMGLHLHRDRLCVVQLSAGDGDAHVVKIEAGNPAPNLRAIMANHDVLKIYHYGRFDIAKLAAFFNIVPEPVYCTKIASRLCRTNTDRHGLRNLCQELLGVEISKQQQTSDWGADTLTEEQIAYAASDVLYLHQLKEKLDALLKREGRTMTAQACFNFLPMRAIMDLEGWEEVDIFAHS